MKTPNVRPLERRGNRRMPCRWPIRVFPENDDPEMGFFFLDSIDITPEGVFLEADLLFSVGDAVCVEFEVPGRTEAVRGMAEVVRVVTDQPTSGMGLRLVDLDAEERWALSRMNGSSTRA